MNLAYKEEGLMGKEENLIEKENELYEKQRKFATSLKKAGIDAAQISDLTGLSMQEIAVL